MPPSRIARRPPTWAWRSWPTWRPTTWATSAAGQLVDCAPPMRSTRCRGCERYRGHFYNWYDTLLAQAAAAALCLHVDSGNLAGPPADPADRAWPRSWRTASSPSSGSRACATRCKRSTTRSAAAPRCHFFACSAISIRPTTRGRRPSASRDIGLRGWRVSAADLAAMSPSLPGPDVRGHTPAAGTRCHLLGLEAACAAAPGRAGRSRVPGRPAETALPAAPAELADFHGVRAVPTLRELAALELQLRPGPREQARPQMSPEARLARRLRADGRRGVPSGPQSVWREIERLSAAERAMDLARMEFGFLYDKSRHLLAIGYNVDERRLRHQLLRPAGVRGTAARVSWPSLQDSFRRSTGSPSGGC